MKGVDHYREAERLVGERPGQFDSAEDERDALARAQVHATLALVYFTEQLVIATRK